MAEFRGARVSETYIENVGVVVEVCLSQPDTRDLASLPVLDRYTDLHKIKQQGLKAPDLDKLDVKNPLHRRCVRCVYMVWVQNVAPKGVHISLTLKGGFIGM